MRTQNSNGLAREFGERKWRSILHYIFLSYCIVGMPFFVSHCFGGESWPKYKESSETRPECALDVTCSDEAVRLGNRAGVCFRSDCAGVVAILHKRNDEVSFRRRFVSYRHFAFEGRFVLKDQGTLESGPVLSRELFLVLPGDIIEFRTDGDDCLAKIDLRNLGYVKRGSLCELQHWLSEKTFMEIPDRTQLAAIGNSVTPVQRETLIACRRPAEVFSYDGTNILHGISDFLKRLYPSTY